MTVNNKIIWLPPLKDLPKCFNEFDTKKDVDELIRDSLSNDDFLQQIEKDQEDKEYFQLFWKETWKLKGLINVWHSNKHTSTNTYNLLAEIIQTIKNNWVKKPEVETFFNEKLISLGMSQSKMQTVLKEK